MTYTGPQKSWLLFSCLHEFSDWWKQSAKIHFSDACEIVWSAALTPRRVFAVPGPIWPVLSQRLAAVARSAMPSDLSLALEWFDVRSRAAPSNWWFLLINEECLGRAGNRTNSAIKYRCASPSIRPDGWVGSALTGTRTMPLFEAHKYKVMPT